MNRYVRIRIAAADRHCSRACAHLVPQDARCVLFRAWLVTEDTRYTRRCVRCPACRRAEIGHPAQGGGR